MELQWNENVSGGLNQRPYWRIWLWLVVENNEERVENENLSLNVLQFLVMVNKIDVKKSNQLSWWNEKYVLDSPFLFLRYFSRPIAEMYFFFSVLMEYLWVRGVFLGWHRSCWAFHRWSLCAWLDQWQVQVAQVWFYQQK